MFAAFLPGCKEGTKSSPVSALLVPDSQAGYQSSLADMPGAIHTISGIVASQKTSESIASILVKLFLNKQEAAKTWSTSDGQFYFSKVPPGLYELEFSSIDEIYATATYVIRVLENGTTQPAAPLVKMITTNPDRLKVQAVIEGEVILEQVGTKLANINVELEDFAGNLVSAALTSSNGHFSFAGIGTGTYSIKAGKASIYAVTPQAVEVSADGVVSPRYSVISLSVPPAEQKYSIVGTVVSQSTNEKLGNVVAELWQATRIDFTRTTSDGQFFFARHAPGLYDIRFYTDEYHPATLTILILEDGISMPATPVIALSPSNVDVFSFNGRVTDAKSGMGLSNIEVSIRREGAFVDLGSKMSLSDGAFSFQNLPEGNYYVTAAANSTTHTKAILLLTIKNDGTTLPAFLEFKLAQSTFIATGRVTDLKTGSAVSGVNLVARTGSPAGAVVSTATSVSDGFFSIEDLASGTFYVTATAGSHAAATLVITIREDGTTVPASLEFKLAPSTFQFVGKVLDAKTGLPVNGADIEVREGSLSNPVQITESSVSDGFFSVRNRAAGTYYVTAGSNLTTHTAGTLMITINSDGTTSPASLEFKLAPSTFQFAGRVVDARTSQALNNIKIDVRKTQAGAIEKTVYSAADGSFNVSGFAADTYYVTAGNLSNSYSESTLVLTIKADGTTSPASLEFNLAPSTFQFVGRVVDARTSQALNNIKIDVRKTQAGAIEKTVYSAADGSFSVSGFAADTYYVTAGSLSNSYSESTLVLTIKADGTTSPASFEFKLYPATYSIAGFVLDKISGEPINGLTVYIKKDSLAAAAVGPVYTSGEGRFSFADLVPATYFIEAGNDSAKYEASYLTVTIGADGSISPASIQIELEPQPNLFVNNVSGNIYDAFTNSPIEYAKITLEPAVGFFTDINGDFRFSVETSGVYTMKVSKDGFEELEVSFRVKEDGTTVPATIDLPMIYSNISGYGSIAGRMVDPATELPQGNLVVRLYLWEQVVKVTNVGGVDVTETDYEVTGLVKSTRTAGAPAPGAPDSEGTFNLTNLSPNSEFVLYFGSDDTDTAFINEGRSGKVATWRVIDTGAAKYVRSYRSVTVQANKTTFISNYEK